VLLSSSKSRESVPEDLSGTMVQVIDILLHAIQVHSVAVDPAAFAAFQAEIQKVRGIVRMTSPEQILSTAAFIQRTVEAYNQGAARTRRAHAEALQKLLTTFTDTVAAISTASETSVARLQEINKQILKASTPEDIKSLTLQASECLESVRVQTLRQHERADQNLAQLRSQVESSSRAKPSAGVQPKMDSLSGLPLRAQAEHVLDTAIQSGGQGFVVAFIIDRVHLINARFGYGVGDQILTLFRQHLAEHLEEGDQLFRWTGPVFLALIDRPSLPEGVRAEVKRVTSKKLETTVQIGSRFVLLPVSSSALVISLREAESAATIIEQVDAFVAGHSRS
jgi:GGDEF domain-containing protein